MTHTDPAPISILVDTNVWLDRYLPGRPGFEVAERILDYGIRHEVELLYPLQAIRDVFFQVAAESKAWLRRSGYDVSEAWAHAINGRAWDCVDNMCEIATAVGADGSDVWYARHLREVHPDFEDDLVLAAARRAKASYLVTSDRQLIQKATVAALTPEDLIKVLMAQMG